MEQKAQHLSKLAGVFPPCTTPFHDEEVAYDRLVSNIERYNETRIRGYMILGSNGEFRSLTDAESEKVVDTYVRYKAPDKTLMVGVARESTKATLDFIKAIERDGIDFVIALPPSYFRDRMSDDALLRYYLRIADASPFPVLIYNAPKFTAGLSVSPELVSKLAQHPNIVGMKLTSSDDIRPYVEAVPEGVEFHMLSGTINTFLAGLEAGAVGGVLSSADYVPDICCELYAQYVAGNKEQAKSLSTFLRNLSSAAAGRFGVAGVKAAMDLLGYYGGPPREPLSPLGEDEIDAMRAVFQREGLI